MKILILRLLSSIFMLGGTLMLLSSALMIGTATEAAIYRNSVHQVLEVSSIDSVSMKPQTEFESLLLKYHERGLKAPFVCLSQTYGETGKLSSNIYKENNNLFGFKCSTSRSYCVKVNRGHAYYLSYDDSIDDYVEWQKTMVSNYEEYFNQHVSSDTTYLNLLENVVLKSSTPPYKYAVLRYATDPKYRGKLRDWGNEMLSKSLVREDFLTSLGYDADWCM
jgi:hypothetical protein